jgi:hypothetical protein
MAWVSPQKLHHWLTGGRNLLLYRRVHGTSAHTIGLPKSLGSVSARGCPERAGHGLRVHLHGIVALRRLDHAQPAKGALLCVGYTPSCMQ